MGTVQFIRCASTVIADALIGLLGLLMTAMPAAAQLPMTVTSSSSPAVPPLTSPAKARLIEWNIPANVQLDSTPGAVVVDTLGHDNNRMWFVTRTTNPHLYRLEFPKSLMKAPAKWTSWRLAAFTTGGIKKLRASYDRRYIFIRTISSTMGEAIERVDTSSSACGGVNCQTTVWQDQMVTFSDVSDIAVDDRNNVFSTHTPDFNSAASYVQRLTPGANGADAEVTRWNVPGSGAGMCGDAAGAETSDQPSTSDPCISGIAVHPSNRNLIYFSEPSTNSIGELNIASNPATVRHWSLQQLTAMCVPTAKILCTPIAGPRQLQIDKRGKVWVVTGSGDLISLDPCTDKMTIHELPDNVLANPWGLAPDDDVVGYTASLQNKVGMLLPKGRTYCVPASSPTPVTKAPICRLTPMPFTSECHSEFVCPIGKTVAADVTQKDDGTFVEARIDTGIDKPSDSMNPLGITPAKSKAQGTFFYTVGSLAAAEDGSVPLVDRVGFARLPVRERIKFPRDDDDENDGADGDHSWHDWHNHSGDHDSDDDGFEDDNDSKTAHEDVRRGDPTTTQGGQPVDYPMTASATSLALIAKAEATDPLAQIGIDIFNPAGLLVATSVPTPGIAVAQVLLPTAGTYTARVRNYGALPATHTATLITREPLVP